jgi:hypothetical protein
MPGQVAFSRLHVGLPKIAEHHEDVEASLRLYFSEGSPDFTIRFAGYSSAEVVKKLSYRLSEAGLTSSLAVLTSLEATFASIICRDAISGAKTRYRALFARSTRRNASGRR